MIPFRRQQTGIPALERMQDMMRDLLAALSLVPHLSGKRVDGVVFPGLGGTVTVQHGLGRLASGYLVLRVYGAATTGEVPIQGNASSDPRNSLVLSSNSAMTCDLWIF